MKSLSSPFRLVVRVSVTSLVVSLLGSCGVPVVTTPVPVVVAPTSVVITPFVDELDLDDITLFFLANDRFVPVSRISGYTNNGRKAGATEPAVGAAIEKVLSPKVGGLKRKELSQGLTSPLEAVTSATAADGTLLTSIPQVVVSLEQGVATLDLSNIEAALRRVSKRAASLAIAQLAYTTLLATSGVGAVRFVSSEATVQLTDPATSRSYDVLHLENLDCLADAAVCNIPIVSFQTVANDPVTETNGKDPLQSE
jgi:hypothetical protein